MCLATYRHAIHVVRYTLQVRAWAADEKKFQSSIQQQQETDLKAFQTKKKQEREDLKKSLPKVGRQETLDQLQKQQEREEIHFRERLRQTMDEEMSKFQRTRMLRTFHIQKLALNEVRN